MYLLLFGLKAQDPLWLVTGYWLFVFFTVVSDSRGNEGRRVKFLVHVCLCECRVDVAEGEITSSVTLFYMCLNEKEITYISHTLSSYQRFGSFAQKCPGSGVYFWNTCICWIKTN